MKTIRLTDAEISHIHFLIHVRQMDGAYYGDKEQFIKREMAIFQKLGQKFIKKKEKATH
jgi:hypothetical protein